jgi:hypothetical protein
MFADFRWSGWPQNGRNKRSAAASRPVWGPSSAHGGDDHGIVGVDAQHAEFEQSPSRAERSAGPRAPRCSGPSDYNQTMSATRPKKDTTPKVAPPPRRPDLARGLPGTDRERAEQRRRFAEEHRETLRRLGK